MLTVSSKNSLFIFILMMEAIHSSEMARKNYCKSSNTHLLPPTSCVNPLYLRLSHTDWNFSSQKRQFLRQMSDVCILTIWQQAHNYLEPAGSQPVAFGLLWKARSPQIQLGVTNNNLHLKSTITYHYDCIYRSMCFECLKILCDFTLNLRIVFRQKAYNQSLSIVQKFHMSTQQNIFVRVLLPSFRGKSILRKNVTSSTSSSGKCIGCLDAILSCQSTINSYYTSKLYVQIGVMVSSSGAAPVILIFKRISATKKKY
jgi:hypothetical protein